MRATFRVGAFTICFTRSSFGTPQEHILFEQIGYHIIEVPEEHADRLMKEARAALNHQIEVAFITEKALGGR